MPDPYFGPKDERPTYSVMPEACQKVVLAQGEKMQREFDDMADAVRAAGGNQSDVSSGYGQVLSMLLDQAVDEFRARAVALYGERGRQIQDEVLGQLVLQDVWGRYLHRKA